MDSSIARIKFAVSDRKNTENKNNIIEIKKK